MAYQLSMDVDGLKVWAHCAWMAGP
jgi:hypothetical protein